MATRQSNTLAVLVWFVGLLGCSGYIRLFYPFGYIPLVIPLLFWLVGNKFSKTHCKAYFNVLLTALIIHTSGLVIDSLLRFFKLTPGFRLMYLGLVYFSIMCLIGLFTALNHKRYHPVFLIHIF